MGLRKGFATLKAIAVTTYWNDETKKSTVSSYEMMLLPAIVSLPTVSGAV
jgi:hypothetical protein